MVDNPIVIVILIIIKGTPSGSPIKVEVIKHSQHIHTTQDQLKLIQSARHKKKLKMASGRNLKNAVIAFLVPLPSIFFYLSFLNHYDSANSPLFWSTLWSWCYHHPLLLANALFFLNVNVLFWLIGLIQSSHWVHTLFVSSSFTSPTFTFPSKLTSFGVCDGADDRPLLDCDTCDACSLLCHSSFGSL